MVLLENVYSSERPSFLAANTGRLGNSDHRRSALLGAWVRARQDHKLVLADCSWISTVSKPYRERARPATRAGSPDAGLFEIAARRCGMSLAGEGWMVGDHPVKDIGGGRAAGLRTIWVDRGKRPDQEHDADHVVTGVLQAMEILHSEA
ncbi:HAD family hydrolase [Microbispora sp. NPDC004025]